MTTDIRDNPDRSRYELLLDGRVIGVADYRVDGTSVAIPHTEVEGSLRGRGLAAELVRYALDDLRTKGRTVDPQCSYVAQFIAENPEYRDLLAA